VPVPPPTLATLGYGVEGHPALANWATVFVAVCIQAMPFLVLGVLVSGAIAAFVPPDALARWLPTRPSMAVPVAALAGVALPGCECGSVPIAGRLVSRGAPSAAALTFLLAAPAVNPVVLVATAVAFPGRPEMVLARFSAGMIAAVVTGWIWVAAGKDEWLEKARRPDPHSHAGVLHAFTHTVQHDFMQAGGYLVVGAAMSATLQTVVPQHLLDRVAGLGWLSLIGLGLLAVVLAVCSEADAFIAAGLSRFSLTSRLVFMTVGPMVDVKLVAMQTGTFGRRFAMRFAPVTFVVCVFTAAAVGAVLL
jgi:uncharacterized membrane protein YraQ (UPF0718 family)